MVLTPKSLRELITANDADGERNNKETTVCRHGRSFALYVEKIN